MSKFVKVAYNHAVNISTIKAVSNFCLMEIMSNGMDVDAVPAGAVCLIRETIVLTAPDGTRLPVCHSDTFITKVGRNRTIEVECIDPPVGCVRVETLDGDVYLIPAYDESYGLAQNLMRVLDLDF